MGTAAANVLARGSLRAAAAGDGRSAWRMRLLAASGAVAAVLVILAITTLPPLAGPVRRFAPLGFSTSWLLPVTLLAHAALVVAVILVLELIGAHRERALLGVQVLSAVVLVAACALAPLTGTATRPVAQLGANVVGIVACAVVAGRGYRRRASVAASGSNSSPVPDYPPYGADSPGDDRPDSLRVRPTGRE